MQRYRTRVKVAPQPETPLSEDLREALSQAKEALEGIPDETTAIVRLYRESPSPLVRDKVRGWKTGHLGRVLDGDFDLFGLA